MSSNNNMREQFPGLAAIDSIIQTILPAAYLLIVTIALNVGFIGIGRLISKVLTTKADTPLALALGNLMTVVWSIVFVLPILLTFFTEVGSPFRDWVVNFEVVWATWFALVPCLTLGLIGLMIKR